MMMNGQAIDLSKVDGILQTVNELNDKCKAEINKFQIIKDFHAVVDKARIDKFLEPILRAWKHPDYSKGFVNNVKMRTWVYNHYAGTDHESVKATDLKDNDTPIAKILLDKQFNHPAIVAASNRYYEFDATRQNSQANRIDKVNNPGNYVQLGYNPFNYSQLTDMWLSFGLESPEISKDTGKMSFSKDVLTDLYHSSEGDIKAILERHLEISQSKNMITQYIPKYYGSTVNGRLHYSLKLMGTLSGRLSGKAGSDKMEAPAKHQCGANGVTQPVGHRVYGKQVKEMLIAPPGRILAAVDYNGLENHINGCLTKDSTIIKLLNPDPETGLMYDMHTLHSSFYFTEDWEKLTGEPFVDTIQTNQKYYALTDSDKDASNLRSTGKGITFGLAYGAYPKKVAKQIGCSIATAQVIFDRYHNDLYPGVTAFREEYVLPHTMKHNSIHLNWGLQLKTDNPDKDIRTTNNANFQGYSNLTMIAATKFRNLYLAQSNPHNIMGLNIIHDALYYELDDTPEAVKWLNDNLIACMVPDFLHNQTVHLRAECDFGYNQKSMVTMPNNADLPTITNKLKELK